MVGLIVEGADDIGCYQVFAEKLRVDAKVVQARGKPNCLNTSLVLQKHIKPLLSSRPRVKKVIVVVDGNCTEVQTRKDAINCEGVLAKASLNIPVHWFVVHYELESWLAHLPETVQTAFKFKAPPLLILSLMMPRDSWNSN